MNVDVKILLPKLGVKVENKLSQVQMCPICHSPFPSLVVSSAAAGRSVHFACTACAFAGDAVDLVSALDGTTYEESIRRFDHTGDLEDCVRRGTVHISQYIRNHLNRRSSEHALHVALRTGHQRMLEYGSEASAALLELEADGWVHPSGRQGVPQDLGFYSAEEFPGRTLAMARLPKRATYIFTAWTANGHVCRVDIRDLRQPAEIKYRMDRSRAVGVFNEAAMIPDNGSTLFVTDSPLAATVLATRHAAIAGTACQVIAADGLPLPQTAHHVQQVILVGINQISRLVKWMGDVICEGGNRRVDIRVLDIDSIETTGADRLLQASIDPGLPDVEGRLVELLIDRFEQRGFFWIQRELEDCAMTRSQCDALLDLMERHDAPAKLVTLLADLWDTQFSGCVLASGARIVGSEVGMVGVTPNGERVSLGNTKLHIERKAVTADRKLLYYCRFECANVPSTCTMWVNRDVFSDPDGLAELVAGSFARRGIPAYVAFYNKKNFILREIADALAGGLTPTPAESRLGVVGPGVVQFPGVRVTATQSRRRNTAYLDIPRTVTYMYDSVMPGAQLDEEQWARMWNDPGAGGYVLGVCHLLHSVMSGIRCENNKALQPEPKHLIYTDSDVLTWIPTLARLLFTLSSDATLPVIGASRAARVFESFEPLGQLPFIGTVSAEGMKPQTLVGCRVNTILNADRSLAASLAGMENVTYVSLDPLDPRMPDTVSEEYVAVVRAGLAPLVRKLINELTEAHLFRTIDHPVPCAAMYRVVGELTGWGCIDDIADMATPVFDTSTGSTLATFFRELGEAVRKNKLKLKESPDNTRLDRTHVSRGPDYVWLAKRTVAAINEQTGSPVDYATIGYLLNAGQLLEDETRHDWKLTRANWERLIAAIPAIKQAIA